MKTIIATLIFVVVGMTSFAQENEKKSKKMIADAEIGDQIIFENKRAVYESVYGESHRFNGVFTINNITRTPDYIISIEIISADGKKYELYAEYMMYNEGDGHVRMCDK